jgi:1-acyl-sn-glycerol-3-phosphate acyltransferase
MREHGADDAVELAPLIPDDDSRATRLRRRVRGVGLDVVGVIVVTALFPLLLIGCVLVDLALWLRHRKSWMAVRMLVLLWWFLIGELYGLISLLVVWVASRGRDGARRRERVHRVKRRWLGGLLAGLRGVLGLRLDTEGLELASPGPMIVLSRHASTLDGAFPDAIVGRAHDIGFRFIIKRELQAIPTIDIGGRWVPTLFLDRASGDVELTRVRALATHLGSRDALLIYPEGTLSTPQKLERAKQIIAERQPEIAPLAEPLQRLLPPRLGGTLALLEAAPEADVVILGHTGLDGVRSIGNIWSGQLVGVTVRLRFWRFPASEIPRGSQDEMTVWLYERWQELDEWVLGVG